MTGRLNILPETLRQIINTQRQEDGDSFEANAAVWFYKSRGKMYMTLELSPRYRPRSQTSERDMTVEEFFDKIADGEE
jgi:hypothetical protein